MRHSWMIEVVKDLQDYALENGLPDTSGKLKSVIDAVAAETEQPERKGHEGQRSIVSYVESCGEDRSSNLH
ncbi:MAG: hypothetical protein AAGA63_01320 [Pseudomonadota bacterium]